MRFLADENFPYPVALGLRAAGHDVVHVAENNAALSDEEVLAAAAMDRRILLTRDKGFGRLVFHKRLPTEGIVLVRIGTSDHRIMLDALLWLIDRYGERLRGRSTVLKEDRARVRPVLRLI